MSDITTEQMIDFVGELWDAFLRYGGFTAGDKERATKEAIRTRLTEYDTLKAEVERLLTEIDRLGGVYDKMREAKKQERIRAEKAEAEVERARPLLEAAKAFSDCASINNWGPLAEAALAYRKEDTK